MTTLTFKPTHSQADLLFADFICLAEWQKSKELASLRSQTDKRTAVQTDKKYLVRTDTTTATKDRRAVANMALPQWRVHCKVKQFCFYLLLLRGTIS